MTCNGKKISLSGPVTVRAFLEAQGYNPARVAVERNGGVIRRAAFDEVLLTDEDILEVVGFVGGG